MGGYGAVIIMTLKKKRAPGRVFFLFPMMHLKAELESDLAGLNPGSGCNATRLSPKCV